MTHGVALWDVVSSCDIAGSADLSIRNARPNDLAPILAAAPIRRIFCNGKTAFALYKKLILPATGREAICLPSTSPANAACSRDALFEAWAVIKNDLEQRTNT